MNAPHGGELTVREAQVLGLVCEGLTSREAAERLGMRRCTADRHLGNAYRKLGVCCRLEALREAVRRGWMPEPGAG